MATKNLLIFSVIINFLFLSPTLGWSRPPTVIGLDYNAEKKILYMEIRHPANREDFIRLVLIYKNGEKVAQLRFRKQTDNMLLIQEVSLEAESQDLIRVKAICNDAGSKEEVLTIP